MNKKYKDYSTAQLINSTQILWQVSNSTKKLKVSFESGTSITVDVLTNMLAVTVSTIQAFRNKTKGLLGIFMVI